MFDEGLRVQDFEKGSMRGSGSGRVYRGFMEGLRTISDLWTVQEGLPAGAQRVPGGFRFLEGWVRYSRASRMPSPSESASRKLYAPSPSWSAGLPEKGRE